MAGGLSLDCFYVGLSYHGLGTKARRPSWEGRWRLDHEFALLWLHTIHPLFILH